MSSQYPWWGVPLVAGVFALAGVLLAQLVTLRISDQNIRHDIDVQWNSEKRRIYSAFLAECAQALIVLGASRRGDGEVPRNIDPIRLSLLAYEMQLVASKELSILAAELSRATQRVVEASQQSESVDESAYMQIRQQAFVASTKFIECARRELAVSDGT
jgi:hypothetical protein